MKYLLKAVLKPTPLHNYLVTSKCVYLLLLCSVLNYKTTKGHLSVSILSLARPHNLCNHSLQKLRHEEKAHCRSHCH